jgi:thiol-disulfide isomerase/thioredoxin
MKIKITTPSLEVHFQKSITLVSACARPRAQQLPPATQPRSACFSQVFPERRLQAAATWQNMPLPPEGSVPIPRHDGNQENLPDAHAQYCEKYFPRRASLWPRGATLLLALAITLGSETADAALYQVGDTVTNLTFTARRQFTRPDGVIVPAGAQAKIQDFAGHIVFIEWFAVWCPFCAAAVPQVETGIVDWYAARGGNPQGVPVLYLFANQEAASFYQTQTSNYINANLAPTTIVFNDYGSSAVRTAFQNSGQPVFVVINGVTNSPSHAPWQVLVNHLGYGETDFNQELANFRAMIDSVQPAIAIPTLNNAQRIGSDFEFNFQTQAGRSYRVLGSTNLVNWTTLQTLNGSTNVTTFRHTNPPPAGNFYRVVTP